MNMRCFNRQISLSTQPLCPLPLPSKGETHLWYVIPDEVKGSSLLKRYLELLSPCEQQRVLCLHEDELRKRALLARALVRTTIARYQAHSYADPRSLKFKKNSYGKPEEAYVKALGRGFSATPFKTFRIHFKAASNDLSNEPHIADSKESEIVVESTHFPNSKWQFALLELANTHYAAFCTDNDTSSCKENASPMALRVWKTVPFLEDVCVSGTGSVVTLGGLV